MGDPRRFPGTLRLMEEHVVIGGILLGHLKRGEESTHALSERDPLERIYTVHP